jgi:ADP-ribosylglycohydrolase
MRGAIIGDIIGSPYEGSGQQKVYDIRLWTEKSHPTDDSALTIATAEAILTGKPYLEMYHKYWYNFPWAGYGQKFAEAMSRYRPDMEGYGSYGNGSAMRVSPVAWAFDDLQAVQEEAKRSAECSHNHVEGVKGAVSVATLIYYARKGKDKEFLKNVITKEFGYDVSVPLEELKKKPFEFSDTCMDTIPPSFRCVYEGKDFTEIIRLAVSLGGDSDTLAAISGSIAEAIYTVPPNLWESSKLLLDKYFEGSTKIAEEFESKFMR